MAKAKTKLTDNLDPISPPRHIITTANLRVETWRPVTTLPAERVHLLIYTSVLAWPFQVEFRDAGSLDHLIEQLRRCRREVWPEAEPLDDNKKIDLTTTGETNEPKS